MVETVIEEAMAAVDRYDDRDRGGYDRPMGLLLIEKFDFRTRALVTNEKIELNSAIPRFHDLCLFCR